jgi:DNA modification methylase
VAMLPFIFFIFISQPHHRILNTTAFDCENGSNNEKREENSYRYEKWTEKGSQAAASWSKGGEIYKDLLQQQQQQHYFLHQGGRSFMNTKHRGGWL